MAFKNLEFQTIFLIRLLHELTFARVFRVNVNITQFLLSYEISG